MAKKNSWRASANDAEPVLATGDASTESAFAALAQSPGRYASRPEHRAEDLIYEAWEATGARRVALAREALALWPDCGDAFVLLAQQKRSSLGEARGLLERGVIAGERAIRPAAFEEDAGLFWLMLETRPYMRARAFLAEVLWLLGHREEAIDHQRELLRLNPNDNQGLRYRQAQWLLALERYDELGVLFVAYDDDAAAAFAYTRVLAAFRRDGNAPAARTLLDEARELNAHVPAYLSRRKKLPRQRPAYIGFGDETEAVDYAADARADWANVPGALAWLES